MKLRTALIAALFCISGPVMAQTQPSTPAPSAAAPARHAPETKAATTADKPLDPAKEAAIRHLMDITETAKMGDGLRAAITARVRDGMSRAIPPEQLTKFMDSFSQKFTTNAPSGAVIDAMIPIYAKAFTLEEIQGLTKFYESPLGQHVVKALPDVVQQSQNAGVQIDQPIAIATLRGMSDEYPQLKQMLPPDPAAPASEPAPSATPPAAGAPAPPTPPAPAPKPAPSTTPPQK